MPKKLRQALFFFFFISFFIIGGLLIIKTQGLLFDFEHLKLVKTGGIYIRTLPSEASIFIDDKEYKRSLSIFNRGTLIKDLFPKKYKISIKSENRFSWEKIMSVESGFVTAASNIRLFEKESKIKKISDKSIENFWITSEGIIEKSGKKLFFKNKELKGNSIEESNENQSSIITKDTKGNLFFIDLSNPESAINMRELFLSLTKKTLKIDTKLFKGILHPFSPNAFLADTGNAIFLIDVKKITLEKIFEKNRNNDFFQKNGNEIFWINGKKIEGYNFFINKKIRIELPQEPEYLYTTKENDIFLILNKKRELFLFDISNNSSTLISSNVISAIISPDEEKVLLLKGEGSIFIYYLEEDTGDIKTIKGDMKQIPLQNILTKKSIVGWFPNFYNYFWVLNEGNFYSIETDMRNPVNSNLLISNIEKILFSEKKIYILKKSGELNEISFSF